ncbi:EAL domain-containing protein [Gammaproteobacteria bacterium]
MSLSKQLLLLISLMFVLIFAGNFAVGVNHIHDYMQLEARAHAQDTATSLGLSLSTHIADPRDPILETMIKAIFDMGYYQEIRLSGVDGNTLLVFGNNQVFEQIPKWFIEFFPLETVAAKSEISAGWNIAGTIHVSINPGYAYLKLYQHMQGAIYYSLAALTLSVLLLSLVLRLTLSPLKKIDRLARGITSGKFSRIEKLPWTTEVRNVAISMNLLSGKIEGIINNLNQKLEFLGQRLLCDELTGLFKMGRLEIDMEQLTDSEGYFFFIKINGFKDLSRTHGDEITDCFLKDFAAALTIDISTGYPEARAYRIDSSEFVLLVRGMPASALESCAQCLRQRLERIGEQYQQKDIVHIGIAPLNPLGTAAGILAAASDACEQAKLIGINSYFIRRDTDRGKTIGEWRDLVFGIIDHGRYGVSYIGPVKDFAAGRILMEEAFVQVFDEAGKTIPVGTFVAMAEKFGKIIYLDEGVTRKVVALMAMEQRTHGIVINLSMATLKSVEFRYWLGYFLYRNDNLIGQLIFGITAYTAAKDIPLFFDFINFIHQQGAKILLKRFDTQLISIETLRYLKPDYIRLARDLTTDLHIESDKRKLVKAMKELGELLDIAIIAEDVRNERDLDIVREIGLLGASY